MLKRFFLYLLLIPLTVHPQLKENLNAAEIKLALKKLSVLGSMLYIAAHPDDENTAVLSYFSSDKLVRSGYLALTRGDGGQNLIGDEQGDLLGVIRTQELLQARSIDGAEQFFTRAIDFGYTKTKDETFDKWGKEKILADVVWVIRKFRPDVIITRFPTTGEGRHGQHTASAILALEAFNAAGNPEVLTEQLKYVEPWQPTRIYWNAWTPALNSMGVERDTLVKINLGSYNALLGKSYTEISAHGRTMHKSQGFGDSGWRANWNNYFMIIDGVTVKNNLFEDIDLSWDRVDGSSKVKELLSKAEEDFSEDHPEKIVPLLTEAYSELQKLNDNYWVKIKSKELLNVIRACCGIWLEAIADNYSYTAGEEVTVKAAIVNRSDVNVKINSIKISYQQQDSLLNYDLKKGEEFSVERKLVLPSNLKITQPYWLEEEKVNSTYNVKEQKLIGLPEAEPPLKADFKVTIRETELDFTIPVYYRKNDPVNGETYRQVEITPPVTVNFENDLFLFNGSVKKEVVITVKNFSGRLNGTLKLTAGKNWQIEPKQIPLNFSDRAEKKFSFYITAPAGEETSSLNARVIIGRTIYSRGYKVIDYPHIPVKSLFPKAEAKIVKLNLNEFSNVKVGYIIGSGDKIPQYLTELGFNVQFLNEENLSKNKLEEYDAIIAGIRAYNTNEYMKTYQSKLMDYVKSGGTYVVQYNTLRESYAEPGPYPFKISRDRVAEEDAAVKILKPKHQLLNFPNKISADDFNNWIQERGLYFPNEWDEKYEPLLEMNDKGESPKRGSLLFTKYGKGIFIYTGLSFFRELPAGVPGAYKLFLNMIFAGEYEN